MASLLLYGALLAALVYKIYNALSKRFTYFKKKGIPQLETRLITDNVGKLFQKKKSVGEACTQFYKEFKKMGVKHGGIYYQGRRTWVPIDPEVVKAVLLKDFTYFSAHNPKFPGLFFNNLFHMDGEEWRDMRKKLTPTFTSGKMKMMFDIILEKTNGLADLVGDLCKTGESAEIKELMARFTTDVIGSCGFGIECNSIDDINSDFFREGQNIFVNPEKRRPSLFIIILILLGLHKPPVPDFSDVEPFFSEIVRDTLKYREENRVIRKDFVHLMIQLKNKGFITELTNDSEDIYEKTVKKEVMSPDDIAGQCLLFFTAGFETSSSAMSFALLELTQNQDVQKKMRAEVREVLKKYNGKITYDALQEMTYCDSVIYETLRKYPPLGVLPRMCTKNYTIPGTNSVIEKGTSVNIPVWGLQMDPEYFPEPEKFIPDRFSPQNKSKIKNFTYMPFGDGPRMCLGLRFGIMQSKAGLATLINRYNFTLNSKTAYPPEFHNAAFVCTVEGGIWMNATKVD